MCLWCEKIELPTRPLVMEACEDLQGLVDRARELQGRIEGEIAGTLSFCRFCSERGRYCNVAAAEAYEDGERLAEIRDSMKDLENMLLHLQRIRSWQLVDRNSALIRLEESRSDLIEKAKQYQGRSPNLMQELTECFGNGGIGFKETVKEDEAKEETGPAARVPKRRLFGFLVSCIGGLFNPWRWHEAAGIALRMVLISVSVSSTVSLIQERQRNSVSSRRVLLPFVGPKREMKKDMTLDVFHGRG